MDRKSGEIWTCGFCESGKTDRNTDTLMQYLAPLPGGGGEIVDLRLESTGQGRPSLMMPKNEKGCPLSW